MIRPLYFSMLFMFFISRCIFGYVFDIVDRVNTSEVSVSETINTGASYADLSVVLISGQNDLSNNSAQLSIINLNSLQNTKSVLIEHNDDPGNTPPDDYFEGFGIIRYPLRNVEISDTDEIVIFITPHPEFKPEDYDAYIACNTVVAKQVKDELLYFSTPTGTTPAFVVSIYKNGDLIAYSGVFGMHLSAIDGEFKSLIRINDMKNKSVVAYINDGHQ